MYDSVKFQTVILLLCSHSINIEHLRQQVSEFMNALHQLV